MSKQHLDVKTHLSRHPHDVSAGYVTSMTTGQLRTMYFDILGPGDSIYYGTHAMARMNDILTAFIGEVDVHFDYFFVPLSMIYTPFGQIYAQTSDILSSTLADISSKDTFPVLDNSNFLFNLNTSSTVGHECSGKETMRMLDDMDCNPLLVFSPAAQEPLDFVRPDDAIDEGACVQPAVSPWLFCAYQAIYQKYYRNDDLERFHIDYYNIDKFFNTAVISNEPNLVKLRYVDRPKDYFTSTRPSALSSSVNVFGSTSLNHLTTKINDYLGFSPDNYYYQVTSNSRPNSNPSPSFSSTSSDSDITTVGHNEHYTPTAANIRALFAVDKFMRVFGRANKNYDDQILAHFGVKVPHDVKHDLTKLASYRLTLQADPLYSLANTLDSDATSGSALGQLGGQANNVLDANIKDPKKFTAPVHGVFMCLAYAVTKPRYFGTFSKLNLLDSRLRFPIPEYDKLGAQPLYYLECSPDYLSTNATTADDAGSMFERIGWQNRYAEFKQRYNRTSLYFVGANKFGMSADNAFSPWVLSRQPLESGGAGLGMQSIKERPDALDGVMAVEFDASWHAADYYVHPQLALSTDPIVLDYMCFAKKVSWMSETGEPDL